MTKLRLGVIGTGRIGKAHISTLVQSVPQAEVVTIADIDLNSAKQVAEKFGIKSVTDHPERIIENNDIDAVVICSSTDTHAHYVIQAAKAGKHIFCEKPVDLTISVIQDTIDAASRAGVKFMPGFNRRFDPNFMKLRQLVTDGEVGEPHILKITSRDPAPPPAKYSAVSGGMFMDMTIHDFDMARFMIGSEIVEVFAKAAVLIDPELGKAGDVDTAVITLTFASGTIGVIDNSRKAVYGYDQRVEVFGSKGMCCADNNYPDNHHLYNKTGVHCSLPLNFFMDRYTEAYANEMKAFCNAVLNDQPLQVTGYDSLMSAAVAFAARKSVLENRIVKLTEIINH